MKERHEAELQKLRVEVDTVNHQYRDMDNQYSRLRYTANHQYRDMDNQYSRLRYTANHQYRDMDIGQPVH